jgi:hypothetical protein
MKRLALIAFACIVLLAAPVLAQSQGSPWVFDVGLRLWGLDQGVGYRGLSLLEGVDTTLWAYVGGAYEKMTYFRQSEALIQGAYAGAAEDTEFYRADANWQLGIVQGLTWNDRIKANGLEAMLFYRGRWNTNLLEAGDLIIGSGVTGEEELLQNTIFAGISWNDVLVDKGHKGRSGIAAEASVDWGPGFFFNDVGGPSNFLRFNATGRAFLPLYDAAPDSRKNLFSMYLAEFAAADYALGLGGDQVPYVIRRTFGGRKPRTGLGYAVRGVDSGSLDVNLKLVNNLELRANLPAIALPDLVPGVVVHWDAGYFAQAGEAAGSLSGFVSTIGAGLYINLLDLAHLAAYTHYRLDGVNADGSSWVPFDLQFGLHF